MPAGSQKESSTLKVARSAKSVSAAVFLSRILGLIREQVLAALFGAGTQMDAFVVAFRIPNLLRDLFAEGALSSAFVTVFTEYDHNKTPEETNRLVSNVFTAIFIILSIICLVGILFSKDLVMLMAPEFAEVPGKIALTTSLTRIMFPFLLLISLAALLMGLLNTRGYFFIPAFASSCFNLGSIIIGGGLALLIPSLGYPAIYGMAIGTLAGGGLQLLIQAPLFKKEGFTIRPLLDLKDPGLRKIGKLIVPAIVGLSATQINIFINTNFASRCAEGSVAWLNYAFRLMQFPIGLFGVALSVATLPLVAKQAAKGEIDQLADTFVSSLVLAFALTVPAAVGLWELSDPIIALIFQHGRFSAYDTLMTGQALKFYAVGLMAYSAVKIIVPVYYALDDTRWPVIASFISVALNVIIILLTLDKFQHRAIALSTSLTIMFNFLFLSIILYKKIGGYPVGRLLGALVKIGLASAVMGAGVMYANSLFGHSSSMSSLILQVATGVTVGICLYGAMLLVLGMKEAKDMVGAVTARLKK
ncbi:MAG: murein biosynthesis integral membrane protein MurJ [Thermodesulfobacteria bacterium]|nr:murein biosynthesis integral membrane protein MurJ [Thermodesulfobacteriota bacterium]